MDHDGMDHGAMCNMNMLFTWETHNLCIVFRQWRITGAVSLLLSLLAIIALAAGYEFVRELSRQYEAMCAEGAGSLPTVGAEESSSLLWPGRNSSGPPAKGKLGRAAFYAVQVFYSFFIMLLFMTYNGWVMLAVAVGAFVGYMIWGNSSSTKSVACH